MKVYYEGDFEGARFNQRAGKKLELKKEFDWIGYRWIIPAVYVCAQGLVVDLCREIPLRQMESFLQRWNRERRNSILTEEEEERMVFEDPLRLSVSLYMEINGRRSDQIACAESQWIPKDIRESGMDDTGIEVLNAYRLNKESAWHFFRFSVPWQTKRKPVLNRVLFGLLSDPITYPCKEHFITKGDLPQKISWQHPVTNMMYDLNIKKMEVIQTEKDPDFYATRMEYSVTPPLDLEFIDLKECGRDGKIHYAKEIRKKVHHMNEMERGCVAYSDVSENSVDEIEWRMNLCRIRIREFRIEVMRLQSKWQ